MTEKDLIKLEKRILGKMSKIRKGDVSPKDSEIGKDLNLLKRLDEPSYDDLLEKYKSILKDRKGNV